MTEVNMEYLKERAARETNAHVRKFAPMIPVVVEAIEAAVGKANVESRNKNQIKILDRWIGKYEHGHHAADGCSHLAIFDGTEPLPVATLRTMRDVEVFVASIKWMKAAIRQSLKED